MVEGIFERAEKPSQNYDFADIVTGTTYVTLYGFDSDDTASASGSFGIASQQIHSFLGESTRTGFTGAQTQERNFDLKFKTSVRLRGELRATFSYGGRVMNAASYISISARLLHVSAGGVETEIEASQTTGRFTDASAGGRCRRTTLLWDVDYKFSKDETLRIEVIINRDHQATNEESWLLHDGAGRNMSRGNLDKGLNEVTPSTFLIQMPFRVEKQ